RVEVWDTGIGIPPSRLKDIFEEFTQIGNPERDRSQGLGLGLAIVDRLSRLLGHKVEVSSIPGKGSCFSIEVERGAAARPPSRRTPLGEEDSINRLVVLIEDEPSILKALSMILRDWGFDVVAASSEVEARNMLGRQGRSPNAIVADYRLRDGRTGAEAIRALRSLYNAPIPSIIITGDTAPERLREAEASGFGLLHKPVQPPLLQSMLSESLRTRH
ncbi:MAG: response regulator, partial [Rhodospirillales bacterium]|nr:response regulator [Rhodospirillales bacterium]